MPFDVQRDRLDDAGMDQSPALNLTRTHHDIGRHLPVNGVDRYGVLRASSVEILRIYLGRPLAAYRPVDELLEYEDTLLYLAQRRLIVQSSFDDQRSSHTTGDLHRDRAMTVRVIPKSPWRVTFWDIEFEFKKFAGPHL